MAKYGVLEKFLKLEFTDEEYSKFTEKNKLFLTKYSIEKSPSPNTVLVEIGEKIQKVDMYFKEYPLVMQAKIRLQEIYNKYNTESRKDGFGSFEKFLVWWYSKEGKCIYCGIDETVSASAFVSKIIPTKKKAWQKGILQIERRIPEKGYIPENCELACVLCNNAKSDMISDVDFERFFSEATKNYWEYIKTKIVEKSGKD